MKNQAEQPEAHWLSAGECAESLGITPRAFRAWSVEPVAIIGRNKYYTGAAILENRMAASRRKTRRPETTAAELKSKVSELETELTNARAEGQRLRNSAGRGELVQLDELTEAIGTAGSAAVASLESLPGRIKRHIPDINAHDLLEIRRIIANCQNEAAELDLKTIHMEVEE